MQQWLPPLSSFPLSESSIIFCEFLTALLSAISSFAHPGPQTVGLSKSILPSSWRCCTDSQGSQILPSCGLAACCNNQSLQRMLGTLSLLPTNGILKTKPKTLYVFLKKVRQNPFCAMQRMLAEGSKRACKPGSDGYRFNLFSFEIYGYRPHKDPCDHHSANFLFSSDL